MCDHDVMIQMIGSEAADEINQPSSVVPVYNEAFLSFASVKFSSAVYVTKAKEGVKSLVKFQKVSWRSLSCAPVPRVLTKGVSFGYACVSSSCRDG